MKTELTTDGKRIRLTFEEGDVPQSDGTWYLTRFEVFPEDWMKAAVEELSTGAFNASMEFDEARALAILLKHRDGKE